MFIRSINYLTNYFKSKPELSKKITIKIVSSSVDGPVYDKDAFNKGKYRPYQFVGVKTE